jgi:hypothetical protein
MVECLPSMCGTLGSIFNIAKRKQQQQQVGECTSSPCLPPTTSHLINIPCPSGLTSFTSSPEASAGFPLHLDTGTLCPRGKASRFTLETLAEG